MFKPIKIKGLAVATIAALSIGLLAGCGAPKPEDTVKGYLKAVQDADYEKISSYIDDPENSKEIQKFNETQDGIDGEKLLIALSEKYEYKNIETVSSDDESAKVKVEITSADMGEVALDAIGDMFMLAFSDIPEEELDKKLMDKLVKGLTDEDGPMSTREVTLNLKKDKEGNFKIVSDDNLTESLIANAKDLENMFQ
jgi:hypothetical protein